MLHRLCRIKEALANDRDLFPFSRMRPRFDVTEYLRGGISTTGSPATKLVQFGLIAKNESRAMLGLPPLAEGGDVLAVMPVADDPAEGENGANRTNGRAPAALIRRSDENPAHAARSTSSSTTSRVSARPASLSSRSRTCVTVIETAEMLGWIAYHATNVKGRHRATSSIGYPDLTFARPRASYFAELKTEPAPTSPPTHNNTGSRPSTNARARGLAVASTGWDKIPRTLSR